MLLLLLGSVSIHKLSQASSLAAADGAHINGGFFGVSGSDGYYMFMRTILAYVVHAPTPTPPTAFDGRSGDGRNVRS